VGLAAFLGQGDRRAAEEDDPGHRDRAAGQLEPEQGRGSRQMLVEHGGTEDDRGSRFHGVDDQQADRERSAWKAL
jgi:hypothetical protein